ncbi:uncharacterized protein TNCV_3404331 [Trichonephila clavipes]|nr:uncharacterized protein TNCV_3404331 [Trichonephila clavipes]
MQRCFDIHLWISFTPNAAVLFVDVAIQPEVRFVAKQSSLMKIGNNGNLVLGPFDESTPCLMIVLMNCQTKLRINHLTAVKSVGSWKRDNSAIDASRKFRTLKGMRKGQLTAKNLRFMVTKFEETGSLNVHSGRGRKPVSTEVIEKVALQVEEDKVSNAQDSTSVRRMAEALDLPRSTFLTRLEVDPEWPWNILWTDEAHFHLDGSVNTHNCRIWETDNPHFTLQVPLYSPKVTVWSGFSTSFILGKYFFEKIGAGGPVTCYTTGQRYASLLRNKIIPDLQARQCLSRTIFMQDGAPPHITRCVKDVLQHHFTEEREMNRQFGHLWPPRSPDLNPCDFWLWCHLK